VAHACNPSSSRDRDQEDCSSNPDQAEALSSNPSTTKKRCQGFNEYT
jgi:hypothetical protein